ncbi:MAG: peptidoglycan DD-metalloendopeptidase family protein [Negativicutes bacterium]|jgi:murein DD-endopeptidase MepM/ murein hydrolase activator NlpD
MQFRKTIIFCLLVLMLGSSVFASELEQKKNELNAIQEQLQIKSGELQRARSVVNNISDKVNVIQQELEGAQTDFDKINDALSSTETAINKTDDNIASLQSSLKERTKILDKRVRSIYENGQISYLDVLLGAKNFQDFINRVEVVRKILTNDAKLISSVTRQRDELAQQKVALQTEQKRLKQLKVDAERTRQLVVARKREQDAVLATAEGDMYSVQQAYQEELAASRRVEQMIRNIERGGSVVAQSTGAMIWPARGPITSPFGWRIHPIYGSSIFHSGIDIGADYGDTIAAADSGVVIYSDWMSGYGKTLIIQHANGITSLYGHCSALLVSVGQRVSKGQAIGRVGSTGNSTGPHLHFEIRVNGSPANPGNYLG